uniref:alpha/beta hydrolase family esterase n=1 Tax=Pedobacter schmidteae TaxID=2201271 RepID=UPI0018D4F645|nr:prolyl oligopeptidase family serine peptidase [Pedobacter schmidteae]
MRLKAYLICTGLLSCLLLSVASSFGQDAKLQGGKKGGAPVLMEWKIGDTTRKALVYLPPGAKTNSTPVIFAFHGHGGTMSNMYTTRRFDLLWPEAIFICPQGLNTPGSLVDQEGRFPGWQKGPGVLDDRDLKFFDAMLEYLIKHYKVDQSRVYCTGHSNGGGFTYLLWATRGPKFAAVAPTAAVAGKLLGALKPKPVLHLLGENDELVKATWQWSTCKALLNLNGCNIDSGKTFAPNAKIYSSASGNPVVIYQHAGGHNYPREANKVIVDFFKLN